MRPRPGPPLPMRSMPWPAIPISCGRWPAVCGFRAPSRASRGLASAGWRRGLVTLQRLGDLAAEEGERRLRPPVLARSYLTATRFAVMAQPLLDTMRDQVRQPCSIGVRDGGEVV